MHPTKNTRISVLFVVEDVLGRSTVLSATQVQELDILRRLRNQVAHAQPSAEADLEPRMIETVRHYTAILRRHPPGGEGESQVPA